MQCSGLSLNFSVILLPLFSNRILFLVMKGLHCSPSDWKLGTQYTILLIDKNKLKPFSITICCVEKADV